ncbi:MAG TPA: hypothetical protein VFW78_05855 [Bacteroidia bacterium]|nr:hypothetical protein [Bacteroidia bacterium]
MKQLNYYIIGLLAIVLWPVTSLSQEPDANKILDEVQGKFLKIKDYEASITIKVDVDFIKIPVKTGTAWFAQPDKVKVKTDGFSLLPKKGMNFSPNQLFTGDFTALYSGEEELNGIPVYVIKVIPKDDTDDILISKLWIDKNRKVIRRLESTTRSQGTFEMNFSFPPTAAEYDLPDAIVFNFDLRKNEIPLGLTGDFNNKDPKSSKGGRNTRGTVIIHYLKYIINQGKGLVPFSDK